MTSPLGRNTFHCCRRYGLAVDDVWLATPAGISRAVESSYDIVQVCTARMILELVFIRCGFLKFSDNRDSNFDCKVDYFIQFLCTSYFFIFPFVYFVYDLHNKYTVLLN